MFHETKPFLDAADGWVSPKHRSRILLHDGDIQFNFTTPVPNWWRRFWYWALLGWRWQQRPVVEAEPKPVEPASPAEPLQKPCEVLWCPPDLRGEVTEPSVGDIVYRAADTLQFYASPAPGRIKMRVLDVPNAECSAFKFQKIPEGEEA